jgi:hypothetical protein
MIVAGPTMCGKTTFVKDLLHYTTYIQPPPKQVLWCYGSFNEKQFKEICEYSSYPIRFQEGIPNINDDTLVGSDTFIIIDDLMTSAGKSSEISQLFTQGMHHRNISVALLIQNIFHQAKKMRDISLNTKYFVLFKSPRDGNQITTLSRQIFPHSPYYLSDAFRQATERTYGYLVVDLTQETDDNYRLVTNIFPHEFCFYFIPKIN